MCPRATLLLIGILVSATRAQAQSLPELPRPRPVAPEQAPQLPQPRLLLPPLAKQALASNYYKPVCEPETPTHGLWGTTPCMHQRSWQECWMSWRDCLEWICTRPTCCAGMRPPADASLYDWLYFHVMTRSSPAAIDTRVHQARPMMPSAAAD